MQPEDRERLIVAEATRYFAEQGIAAGTLGLARRLGISQPLLYKYFPTKDALVEKVFEGLFPGAWDPRWESLLDDQSLPVRDRLALFYKDFAKLVLTYEHVRLFLFSGLANLGFNSRYYQILTRRIFTRIARALRSELAGDKSRRHGRITDRELEIVQSLHAAVYHLGFRRWVHNEPFGRDLDRLIDLKVEAFLHGAKSLLGERADAPTARKPSRIKTPA